MNKSIGPKRIVLEKIYETVRTRLVDEDNDSIGVTGNPLVVTATGTVPLPTGAATEALQTSGNALLTTISTIDFSTSAKQDAANTLLTTIAGDTTSLDGKDFSLESGGNLDTISSNTSRSNTETEYNVTLTSADTQYSQALPSNTIAIEFQNRSNNDLRFSLVDGKVATPTAPYSVLKAGQNYYKENLNLTGETIYFANSNAGDIVELLVWSVA